jgi:hypothetical protein
MKATKQWNVEVSIGEEDGHTYAQARLVADTGDRMMGIGQATAHPHDYDVPEIGDELAVARALNDLGHRLLVTTAADIHQLTDEEVRLPR